MRLVADENMPAATVAILRDAGHDVVFITEDTPGKADADIMAQAVTNDRVLVTLDKDFGSLIHRERRPSPAGIVFFRLFQDMPPHAQARFVAHSLMAQDDWSGWFWTITIRRSQFPE